MNKKPSEIIREKILQNGGRAIVHSLTGKPYEIRHGSDGKSFLSGFVNKDREKSKLFL
ncbi:MAG: hypothetical protein IKY18_02720 [Oscillospiraceae bacterium]|nr:hypothetical protein [Oscillospiraceae bacterium]